tara:strand:- start:2366 stop:2710 length:345 start_codon:yes stop_codon:yes gene_type:complete
MSLAHLLPKSHGEAMNNFANNFPVGTLQHDALSRVTQNAVAAWVHLNGTPASRFTWGCNVQRGPKATLLVVSNGPNYFAKEWSRLFITKVVMNSRLFYQLPREILFRIIQMSEQ